MSSVRSVGRVAMPLSRTKASASSAKRVKSAYKVAVGRARFWPQLTALLEPAGPGAVPEARFLGVLGTHHWGLTLPAVNRSRDGSVNPFPRTALLKAIAAQAATDLSTG